MRDHGWPETNFKRKHHNEKYCQIKKFIISDLMLIVTLSLIYFIIIPTQNYFIVWCLNMVHLNEVLYEYVVSRLWIKYLIHQEYLNRPNVTFNAL